MYRMCSRPRPRGTTPAGLQDPASPPLSFRRLAATTWQQVHRSLLIAGLAGAFYGHYTIVLSPQMADFNEMAKLIIMVVVGGLGAFAGPLIGAPPVQILTTYLAKYGEWDMVIYAVLVIALMRSYIGGLAAMAAEAMARLRRQRA